MPERLERIDGTERGDAGTSNPAAVDLRFFRRWATRKMDQSMALRCRFMKAQSPRTPRRQRCYRGRRRAGDERRWVVVKRGTRARSIGLGADTRLAGQDAIVTADGSVDDPVPRIRGLERTARNRCLAGQGQDQCHEGKGDEPRDGLPGRRQRTPPRRTAWRTYALADPWLLNTQNARSPRGGRCRYQIHAAGMWSWRCTNATPLTMFYRRVATDSAELPVNGPRLTSSSPLPRPAARHVQPRCANPPVCASRCGSGGRCASGRGDGTRSWRCRSRGHR